MDFGGVTVGMREGVIVLITLVAVYIVVVLVRMLSLRRRNTGASPAAPGDAGLFQAPSPAHEPPAASEYRAQANAAREFSAAVPAAEVGRQRLEQEVSQLRDEVDAIRGELAALRQDMRQELAHLQAAQAVSPIYGDAMQMAAAGYDPAVIAERCGIARAEAELVVALAKSQER